MFAFLLLLLLRQQVPVLDQLQVVDHLLLLELLLLDPRLLTLDGKIQLLLLGEAAYFHVPAFTEADQVARYVLEDRIQRS